MCPLRLFAAIPRHVPRVSVTRPSACDVPPGDRYARALSGKGFGQRAANAGASTGNHCMLGGKLRILVSWIFSGRGNPLIC